MRQAAASSTERMQRCDLCSHGDQAKPRTQRPIEQATRLLPLQLLVGMQQRVFRDLRRDQVWRNLQEDVLRSTAATIRSSANAGTC